MSRRKPYGERAARRAADLTGRTRAILGASTGRPASPAPVGSVLVLLLGLWVFVAIPVLDPPYSAAGWDTSLRDEGVAAVLMLCGLVLRVRPRNGAAAAVAGACGLTLVAMGLWSVHDVDRTAVNELLTGIAVVIAAATARVPR